MAVADARVMSWCSRMPFPLLPVVATDAKRGRVVVGCPEGSARALERCCTAGRRSPHASGNRHGPRPVAGRKRQTRHDCRSASDIGACQIEQVDAKRWLPGRSIGRGRPGVGIVRQAPVLEPQAVARQGPGRQGGPHAAASRRHCRASTRSRTVKSTSDRAVREATNRVRKP